MNAVIPNKFEKRCADCKKPVPVKTGLAICRDGRWSTMHTLCAKELGITLPEEKPAETRRMLTKEGKIVLPFERETLSLVRSFPGARFNPKKVQKGHPDFAWFVSLELQDRPRVLELAEKLKLEIDPGLRQVALSAHKASTRAIEAAGRLGFTLYPFQIEGVSWLAPRTKALLGDDMGLGKTVQTLMALPEDARALIICPKSLRLNWQEEAEKWRPDLRVKIFDSKERKIGQHPLILLQHWNIVIVNYDVLPAFDPALCAEGLADRIIVIPDEAHKLKNRKSKRTIAFKSWSGACKKTWLLTGTPLLNEPFDLFGVLAAGEMAHLVFGRWQNFLDLFHASPGKWGGYVFGMPSPEVPERLRRVMLRRTKAEVLPELPPKVYQDIPVELPGPKSLIRELDELWEGWEESKRDELPSFEKLAEARSELAKAKIPAMLETIEDYEEAGLPVLVFAAHRSPIDELEGREGWHTITGDTSERDRHEAVKAFHAGELKGLGLMIQAAGVGLTLTRAADVLFVDEDYTPALNAQAIDRACRIGQKAEKIIVKRLVADHPLDRRVAQLLAQKTRLFERTMNVHRDQPAACHDCGNRLDSEGFCPICTEDGRRTEERAHGRESA